MSEAHGRTARDSVWTEAVQLATDPHTEFHFQGDVVGFDRQTLIEACDASQRTADSVLDVLVSDGWVAEATADHSREVRFYGTSKLVGSPTGDVGEALEAIGADGLVNAATPREVSVELNTDLARTYAALEETDRVEGEADKWYAA